MVLIVFAAVAAMLFAPKEAPRVGAEAEATRALPSGNVAGAELANPWAKGRSARSPGTGLATDAAALAAGDIRDPWAAPKTAPPGPVVLVDTIVDPWSQEPTSPRRLRAPLADPPAWGSHAAAGGSDLYDPWTKRAKREPRVSRDIADPWAPPPAEPASSRDGVRDPWRKARSPQDAQAAPAAKAAEKPAPKRSAAKNTAPSRSTDLPDPWRR